MPTMTVVSDQIPVPSPDRRRPLIAGLNHTAVLTADADRLAAFYAEVFGLEVLEAPSPPGTRTLLLRVSPTANLTVIEAPGTRWADGSGPMLGRGHIDHVALEAPDAAALETLRRRLVASGASDGSASDYGPMVAVGFVDPDGMASEVCWIRDPTGAGMHAPVKLAGPIVDPD
jgi:catechol 2,3-dioxygenase-like lactoylglutathione lyase family enzyme